MYLFNVLFTKSDEEPYPNPTSDFLMIRSEEHVPLHKAEICSLTGKLLATLELDETSEKIDLPHLNSGLYLLKLYGTEVHTRKISIVN